MRSTLEEDEEFLMRSPHGAMMKEEKDVLSRARFHENILISFQ